MHTAPLTDHLETVLSDPAVKVLAALRSARMGPPVDL